MGERLRADGFERPEFVAAVLEIRARTGLGRAGFAELLHVDPSAVDALEAGRPARATLAALARLGPDIDWSTLVGPPPAEATLGLRKRL